MTTNTDKLADALDCFWNAALHATHQHEDATANAVMAGMAEGFAAVAARLREPDEVLAATPAPAADNRGQRLADAARALGMFLLESHVKIPKAILYPMRDAMDEWPLLDDPDVEAAEGEGQ